uniref:Uncharacterized protein n=1 Tax=Parascaris equorum TaxID=6256 RepID=A0A914R7Y6_PAREQ
MTPSRENVSDRAENEETGSSNENATIRTFRSYDPLTVNLGEKKEDVDLFIVEKEIGEQLADTEDTNVIEQVDISTLAPRKVTGFFKNFLGCRFNFRSIKKMAFGRCETVLLAYLCIDVHFVCPVVWNPKSSVMEIKIDGSHLHLGLPVSEFPPA